MASWCLFLVVNVLVCSALSGLALGSPSSDVAVLQELLRKWKATARPDVFENWRLDEDADPCTERWNGVVCNPTKSVIHLHLNGANLSGGIPPAIGALDELITLDLSGNPLLSSCIPSEIGHLRHLTHFKVSSRFISNELKFRSHRALLQVAAVVARVTPPVTAPAIPPLAPAPVRVPAPVTPPVTTPVIPPPAPAPVRVPAPVTPPVTTPVIPPPAPAPVTPPVTTPAIPPPAPAPVTPPVTTPVIPPPAPAPVQVPAPVTPPVTTPAIPPPAPAPVRVPAPAPVRVPARAPVRAPASSSTAQTYLKWVGIGLLCLVFTALTVFCICRKFGQYRIHRKQRLPPLTRYNNPY